MPKEIHNMTNGVMFVGNTKIEHGRSANVSDDDVAELLTRPFSHKHGQVMNMDDGVEFTGDGDGEDKNKALDQASGLWIDGPTLKEYVAAGYRAEYYPPPGYVFKDESGKVIHPITGRNHEGILVDSNGIKIVPTTESLVEVSRETLAPVVSEPAADEGVVADDSTKEE